MDDRELIRRQILTLQVIGVAMGLGVVLYLGITVYLISTGVMTVSEPGSTLPTVLFAVATGLILVGPVVGRRVTVPPPGFDRGQVLNRYQAGSLISLAMVEGGGMVGITGGLLSADGSWAVIFGLAAIAMMTATRPRAEELERLLRGRSDS